MSKRSSQRHRHERSQLERQDDKFEQSTTAPIAIADETRALDALGEIVERKMKIGESVQPRFSTPTSIFASVYRWMLSCMAREPSERATFRQWDAWYRKISKEEPFLAGVLSSVVQTDANRGWTLTGGKRQVNAFTEKFHGFDSWIVEDGKPVKGSGGGWRSYVSWQSQSYHTTRMGCVSETGREGRAGPLFTLWSVDPCRAELTGNPSMPLRYFPATGPMQEWTSDQFIRGKSLVSTDEAQSGYGCPAVERCYQLAKVMVAVVSHYQQKLNASTPDAILTGKYIGEEQWNEALRARAESLRADSDSYLNSIATIMSSGGDMPEFALTMLSSLPDRWDIELWTKILMRGYELAFGYKGEFSWENAGVMGRGNEVQVQHRNATAQGGKDFILSHQEQLQSVLPPTLEFAYEERDVTGEQEDAALKLTQAQVVTEMTKWLVNTQSVLTADQVMQLAVEAKLVPDNWTPFEEDVTATDEEMPDSERIYRACQAFPDEPVVRYHWPSNKMRTLYRYGADRFIKRFRMITPNYAGIPA